MSEQDEQRIAERLLEGTLAAYGECEPPPGLEERILGKVRAARLRRSLIWPVLAVAATLLLGIVLVRDWRAIETPKTMVQTPTERPAPARPVVGEPTGQLAEIVPQAPKTAPRRLIARRPVPPAPRVQTEEHPIPPVPVSEIVLAEMPSAEIQIENLVPEPEDLEKNLSQTADAPLALEPLAGEFEEGRKR